MTMQDRDSRILDMLEDLLVPGYAFMVARDATTGDFFVGTDYDGTYRGVSLRDALSQYCQSNVG